MIAQKASVTVRAGDLKSALPGLGKLIARKSSLPVLGCVKVEAAGADRVRLTATDLDLSLSVEIPATVDRGLAPFLLPMPHLRERVHGLRADETVPLGPVPKAPPAAEFPELARIRTPGLTLPEPAVASLLRAFACASQDFTRAVLRGACLDTSGVGDKAHRIVGTDGRCLYSGNSLHLPLKHPVILPDHPLWRWKPLADSRPWTLRLGQDRHGTKVFRLEGPSWSVTGRPLDGPYPNYRQVIPGPEQLPTRATLGDEALAAMSRLLPRLPGKELPHRPVGLHCEKGRFGLLAKDGSNGPWVLHPVDRCGMEGPDATVFVDREILARAAAFGLNRIELGESALPMQFRKGSDLLVAMPVSVAGPVRIERPRLVPAVEQFAPPPSPKPAPKKEPAKQAPKSDPLAEARQRVAEADGLLLHARKSLKGVNRSLHAARTQRSETRSELTGFRALFRKLRKARKDEAA